MLRGEERNEEWDYGRKRITGSQEMVTSEWKSKYGLSFTDGFLHLIVELEWYISDEQM